MTEFLSYKFEDTCEFVNTFDEQPLWSAAFGLLLLKYLELKANIIVLDIGSGTGFPLLELAGRLGNSSKLYGLDPWINANARANQKIRNYDLTNVEIIEGTAERIPFDANTFDIITSNLGINNFTNPDLAFKECNRVIKPKGKLALTTNLNGHWKTFYDVFENTLNEVGKGILIGQLTKEQEHRGTIQSIKDLFIQSGFKVTRFFEDTYVMRFLDGTAFLNHYFIKLGWLSSWRDLIPEADRIVVFTALERNLNELARREGSLVLNVPMLFIEGEK